MPETREEILRNRAKRWDNVANQALGRGDLASAMAAMDRFDAILDELVPASKES